LHDLPSSIRSESLVHLAGDRAKNHRKEKGRNQRQYEYYNHYDTVPFSSHCPLLHV
jgi:hypothetical protein